MYEWVCDGLRQLATLQWLLPPEPAKAMTRGERCFPGLAKGSGILDAAFVAGPISLPVYESDAARAEFENPRVCSSLFGKGHLLRPMSHRWVDGEIDAQGPKSVLDEAQVSLR